MIKNQKSHNLFFRDGTSQQDRELEAIQPDYIQIEGRSIKELIIEAQRLAKELRFFDENNEFKSGIYWDSFLVENGVDYLSKTPIEQQVLREQWANQLAAYVENPDCFLKEEEKQRKLAQPHVVLFLTFLKLLNHVKAQINGLTQKHLDFFFKERLGLTPKDAVPDVVNVLIELVENIEDLEIKKDTVLLAGVDPSGNKLHYHTNEDTTISKSKIAQLKNVFVDKQKHTIKSVHLTNKDTADLGLTSMLEMAVGHPNPENLLPSFTGAIKDVFELHDQVQKGNEAATNYVTDQIFLTIENFNLIFEKHEEEKQGAIPDWEEVYIILDSAYKDKIKHKRQQQLKELHQTTDFDSLIKHVYGNPLPGDQLPLYKGKNASLDIVFEDLKSAGDTADQALDYVEEELKLKEQDFIYIIETSKNQNVKEEDTEDTAKMYRLLELADRQVRRFILPSPIIEQVSDVYAATDAKANAFSQYEEEEESKRFKTFGSKNSPAQSLQPANIGLAISSPTLLLREGYRGLHIVIEVDAGSETEEILTAIDKASKEALPPLLFSLSSEQGWFQPADVTFEKAPMYSNGEPDKTLIISTFVDHKILTVSGTVQFDDLDQGKYLKIGSSSFYQITKVESSIKVEVKWLSGGEFGTQGDVIFIHPREQVFIHNIGLSVNIDENEPSVVPFGGPLAEAPIQSEHPCLSISINREVKESSQETPQVSYQQLAKLKLLNISILVAVKDMQNVVFQNERGIVDVKKAFEPFGTTEPETGDSFYLANEEICNKKLESINIKFDWINLPTGSTTDSLTGLGHHYLNYWHIQTDKLTLDDDDYTISSNSDIKGQLFFNDKRTEIAIEPFELLKDSGDYRHTISDKIKEAAPNYDYQTVPNATIGEDEVTDWDRYFRVELDPIDFQHSVYHTLFAKQALSTKPEIKALAINPPYKPKVKSVRVSYQTYLFMAPGVVKTTNEKMYHVHPFGYKELNTEQQPDLLPTYKDEGTLYLGVSQLKAPEILSILFQMAEGSADPDSPTPELQWSYMRHNEWVVLSTSAILLDTTNGLINTGIVKIKIPEDATTGGTLMPNALHWLSVTATSNIAGISDTIDIRSQVISATLANANVDPLHFQNPLAAASITKTQTTIPEIALITQPFTASKGKAAEQGDDFYNRISERLRHKNRAITPWDYERIVLDNFPEIYKVKCLPSTDELGKVNLVVVPDIRKKLPFNPFAPKVASDTLFKIKEYLDNHSPAYAEIAIHNPSYLQVLTKCVVKFNTGYDAGFYKEKLINEIKRFLSPWAYDQDNEIRIGGNLHASVLINFIAEQPYIDYVANLNLFQSEDGETFTDVRTFNDGKSIVVPSSPDMVMVSGPTHFIEVFDENGYDEDSFEGINYMQIKLDFIVSQDLKQS